MTKLPHQEMIEQKITQQVTITAGDTGRVTINIPNGKTVFLKGYGYSWFKDNKYILSTGNTSFPRRSDQEGSPSIPVIFGTPFKCRSGGELRLTIENGDATDHTYDIVFYIITDELLDIESTGGDLNFTIGGATGVASSVAIVDTTGSTHAGVTADGLQVYTNKSLPAGTNVVGKVVLSDGTTDVDVVARGDGVHALCVDTELTIDGATVNIENVFNASTDGTVAGAGYMLMDSNNRLETISGETRTATHSAVTVGSTDTSALASNVNRKSALFINDSDETIYLSIGGTAVANTGIRLNPNGGSYEMSKEQGNLSTAVIKAICSSGSKNLLVTEFV